MKDLKIVLNQVQQQQVYYPGSVVSGSFSFVLEEAKSYNYVQIGLFGASHVHWTESHSTGTGDNRRTETRSYTSNETYVEQTAIVWSKEQSPTGTIGPGSYEYQFQFTLPPKCPSSFEGSVGRIRYSVQGRIGTGLLKFDNRVEAVIQVNQIIDINQPSLLTPVRQSNKKQVGCLCCVSGDIELTAEIPRTGYCINNDTIPLSVTVQNGSSRTIRVRASIVRHVRYYAQGHQHGGNSTVALVGSPPIDPRTTTGVELPTLQVPSTAQPTISDSSNIKLFYALNITAVIPWALNLTVPLSIVVGNVPYQEGGAGVDFGALPQPSPFSAPPSSAAAAYPPPYAPATGNANPPPIGFVPDNYPPHVPPAPTQAQPAVDMTGKPAQAPYSVEATPPGGPAVPLCVIL